MKSMTWFCAVVLLACARRGHGATVHVWNRSPHNGPGSSWETAFREIQDGVDAADPGDTVLVTNGVFRPRTTVTVQKAVTVRSVNGPSATTVDGAGKIRGLYIGAGAVVEGFTIRNAKGELGGGVHFWFGGTVSNCVITGNTGGRGGGAYCNYGGMLENCIISGNSTDYGGGGVYLYQGGTVRHCTIVNNSTTGPAGGGGVLSDEGTLLNSIVYFNTNGNVHSTDTVEYCCTTPAVSGEGNITNDPQFMGLGAGDLRLRIDSPCIDTANTLPGHVTAFGGTTRPLDGDFDSVALSDMGAHEYDPAATDCDGDGRSDADEVALGHLPLYDESHIIAHGESNVTANPTAYDLFTSNSILDLNMGAMMVRTSNGWLRLRLQLERTEDLTGGAWSNAGDAVEWEEPAGDGNAFYRVRGME